MRILNGPGRSAGHLVRRDPIYLRVVVDQANGGIDVLDQSDDVARPSEAVYAYVRDGAVSVMHIDFKVDPAGSEGANYMSADYLWLRKVDAESLRDNTTWDAWMAGRDYETDRKEAFYDQYEHP